MATTQKRAGQWFGFTPNLPSTGVTAQALNAANTWLGFSFVAGRTGLTLSAVRTFVSAVAGTLAAGDLTASLYSDSSGLPASGAALETHACTGTPSAGAVVDCTGFTTALTIGNQYWIVFKNANGTPASNNMSIRWAAAGAGPAQTMGTSAKYGWMKSLTTTGDGGWAAGTTAIAGGIRLAFADGSYGGLLVTNLAASTNLVYASREAGAMFTMPSGPTYNARRLAFYLSSNTGSPTGGVYFRLYSGSGASPSLLGTTYTIPSGNVNGNGWYEAAFSSDISVAGGTVLRATVADATPAGADSASNAYKLYDYTIDSDTNSLALLPFEGTQQGTYCSTNNTSFAQTSTVLNAFALLLDSDGEFVVSGGGGGGFILGG